MLIAARAIQAIGGGGILPIATAEIGTEVPEERRGLALGLVGAVFGMANLLGASAGSLILDIAGSHNWQWIFYVNVPIAALIVIAGVLLLPNHRETTVAPLDLIGTALLVAMIMSLLYGLTNIDFVDLGGSLRSLDVWPFLLAFVVLLPVFVLAERRAADPVLNLRYFTQAPIALTLLASFLSGFILMGVVFVPQLAENALQLPSGSGGYLVIILGLASGVGAPLSGRLTDQFGPKRVLAIGASISALAAVSVIAWVIPAPGYPSVIVTLILIGLGLGFVIGSPLNYLMLRLTPRAQSNSALGTLSLVRSIGTTLAPVIMVGFLARAGGLVQDRLTRNRPQYPPDHWSRQPRPTRRPSGFADDHRQATECWQGDREAAEVVHVVDLAPGRQVEHASGRNRLGLHPRGDLLGPEVERGDLHGPYCQPADHHQ
jgi:MFS family permease